MPPLQQRKDEELARIRRDRTFAGGRFFGRTPGGIVDITTGSVLPEEDTPVTPQAPAPATVPTTTVPTAPTAPIPSPIQPAPTAPQVAATQPLQPPQQEFTQQELGLNIPTEFLREGTVVPVGDRRFRISPTGSLIEETRPSILRQQPITQPTAVPPAPELPPPVAPPTAPAVVTPEDQQKVDTLKTQFGVPELTLDEFNADPLGSIKDIMKSVLDVTQVSEGLTAFQDISNKIEEIENQRDEEIAEINDNPFLSEAVRAARVRKTSAKFEQKIDNRVNKLKLIEGALQREQSRAQFAAQLALSVYDKERNFQLEQFQFAQEQAISELTAGKKLRAEERGIAQQEFTNVFQIRKEFDDESKDFIKIRDAYGRIIASAVDPSAAGDLALIFNYMKVLDPGSVVRESEFATAQNAAGVPNRIRAIYNRVVDGQRLSADQRGDFVDRGGKLYQSQLTQQRRLQGEFANLASEFGLDPDLAAPDLASELTVSNITSTPEGNVVEPSDADIAYIRSLGFE